MKDTGNLNQYILTADIGGSHITAAICNSDTRVILPGSMIRIEVLSNGSAEAILGAWGRALKETIKLSGTVVTGVGVAMPGPFDYEKGISYITGLSKYEALYGLDIKAHVAEFLQLDPAMVRFRNDAEATIAGEALAGAGKGYNKVVGVTLGTGFGSAICTYGVARDLNLGSDPYKDSIADDHLSTRWFLKRYHELTGANILNVKELAGQIRADPFARRVFEEFGSNMAEFLSRPLSVLSPDVLVLCGNIAKASAYFCPNLKLA